MGELTFKNTALNNRVFTKDRSYVGNSFMIIEPVGEGPYGVLLAHSLFGLVERIFDVIMQQSDLALARAFAGDAVGDGFPTAWHAGLEAAIRGGSRGSEGDEAQEEKGLHIDMHDDSGISKEKMCK